MRTLENVNDGKYILRFDMVQDMVTWFSQKGDKPLNLLIEIAGSKVTILKNREL